MTLTDMAKNPKVKTKRTEVIYLTSLNISPYMRCFNKFHHVVNTYILICQDELVMSYRI